MTELHDSLKHIAPADWSTIPTEKQELESYLGDLFSQCQLVVDSVPLPAPDDAPQQPQAQARGRASKASEVTLSSERSAKTPFGHEKFQKEWGKPLKIKPQENPLGISVYKMSGKDGRGAWFARHSVHEGIGFSQFKKSMEMEFEKSLSEPGPPGTGSVRGIGGEERLEQIKTDKGTVEVYRLTAQFPGPTAARDFVTMLVTSDKAMHIENESKNHLAPRHYMVISRPCNHPKTQPKQGFVRGFYESIEFIREVPRKLKASQSSIDLASDKHHKHPLQHLKDDKSASSASVAGRRQRAATDAHAPRDKGSDQPDPTDPEDNPVEWMMITRSDPGGGIPRFLVERGTPGSICGDAVKFVDWATQNEDDLAALEGKADSSGRPAQRKESYQSWRGRSVVGVVENQEDSADSTQNTGTAVQQQPAADQTQHNGMYGTVAGAASSLRQYTPQVILDRLPAAEDSPEQHGREQGAESSNSLSPLSPVDTHDSFASASEGLSSSEDGGAEKASMESQQSPVSPTSSKQQVGNDDKVRKLDEKKQALQKKFAETQSKFEQARSTQADTEEHKTQKVIDKHEKDLKKHEEKFHKEIAKIEQKQEKERKKAAEKEKKKGDKDEKARLTRERDEARHELDSAKKEADTLRKVVEDLQKENTAMVAKLGKNGLGSEIEGLRSRGSSLSRRERNEKK